MLRIVLTGEVPGSMERAVIEMTQMVIEVMGLDRIVEEVEVATGPGSVLLGIIINVWFTLRLW